LGAQAARQAGGGLIETTKSIYDALGERYDRWTVVLGAVTPLARVRKRIVEQARGEVLEVAVGAGANFAHYDRSAHVTGVDFSEPMLAAARKKAASLGLSFTGAIADAEALPFGDATFDTVVCTLAACTFAHPERAFAEMRRVLKPGGEALLVEHVQARGALGRALLDAIAPLTVRSLGCHPNRHTEQTLIASGLSPVRVERALGGVLLGIVARGEGTAGA
jgi:ubiquinone/menaquinone biosynthesis C-methylase UbiE